MTKLYFHSNALSFILSLLVFVEVVTPVTSAAFLERIPAGVASAEFNSEFDDMLLSHLDEVLGGTHRTFVEKRLNRIKDTARSIVTSLPKNPQEKLGSAAVSYAMHRLFVKRHAWFVKGFDPAGQAMAFWNTASPVKILQGKVPQSVVRGLDARLNQTGFGLHEVAVLAATLEHLVYKEALARLDTAYQVQNLSSDDILSAAQVEEVMDTYMAIYILGVTEDGRQAPSTDAVRELRSKIFELYPTFPDTQKFVRDTKRAYAPGRERFFFSDVTGLVEELGDRYGPWQDGECRDLKSKLLKIEDRGAGGAGRVHIADFYNSALNHGHWQFSESVEYLKALGAIDDSDPSDLKIMIANYINGPSNCVASSQYYSVCCINECEELLGHLEEQLGVPNASAAQISSIVRMLPSSTTAAGNRSLSAWLLRRLSEMDVHHGGHVPLHGRLFAQWMHYAYPRECPFPHVSGTTNPQRAEEFMRNTQKDFAASVSEMKYHINLRRKASVQRVHESDNSAESCALESAMWSIEEELVVGWLPGSSDPSLMFMDSSTMASKMRIFMFLLAGISTSAVLIQTLTAAMAVQHDESMTKYYV